MIEKLMHYNVGDWVMWRGKINHVEVDFRGRIKSYDNTKNEAQVVVESNATRDILNNRQRPNDWKNFISEPQNYSVLSFTK